MSKVQDAIDKRESARAKARAKEEKAEKADAKKADEK